MMNVVNGSGAEWSPALLAQLLDRLLSGGLKSLDAVLRILRSAAAQPLLLQLRDQREVWCRAVEDVVQEGDKRDLIIGKHARIGLLSGSDTEVRHLADYLASHGLPYAEAEEGVSQLFRRYSAEVAAFMASARPTPVRSVRPMEEDHALFSAVG